MSDTTSPYPEQTPPANPYLAANPSSPGLPAYQPTPFPPAPAAPAPYTIAGVAYSYAPRTNSLAIASLVLSLASLVFSVTAIVGVILGHVALSQIRRRGEGGRGLAIAGLVIGYVFIALYGLFFALILVLIFAFGSSSSF